MMYPALRRQRSTLLSPPHSVAESRADNAGSGLALTLQRTAGNRAVGRILASASRHPAIRIGDPGSAHEREADRVADRVMRMPFGGTGARESIGRVHPSAELQRCACGCGGKCNSTNTEDDKLYRSATGTAPAAGVAPRIVHDVVRSAGAPLDAATRSYMELRFGRDFSHVRIHTDDRAAESARAVNAVAYAVGNHMVFDRGRYAPESRDGRRLLAHELTHVVQQHSAGESLVQRELVFGSGYARPFGSDAAEVRCARDQRGCKEWFPSSLDLRATATSSGGGTGAATFKQLLDHIAAAAPGSITELGLIGHANHSWFGLGGRITRDDVIFADDALIGAETLKSESVRIAGLRNRFAKDAKITLYGCNSGVGKGLLDAISQAFQVCVQGFTDEITWCIRWHPRRLDIFSRGKTWIPTSFLESRDTLPADACERIFHDNIRDLHPDQESCAGVPTPPTTTQKPKPEPTEARRFGLTGMAGASASDQGWRAAIDLGLQYSLRRDKLLVLDPIVGAHLLYLPPAGDAGHMAAALAEIGLRIRQPKQGFYVDARIGGYAGFQLPENTSATAVGGFTAAAGAGYRWERVEIGAQARALLGAEGKTGIVVIGAGVPW